MFLYRQALSLSEIAEMDFPSFGLNLQDSDSFDLADLQEDSENLGQDVIGSHTGVCLFEK